MLNKHKISGPQNDLRYWLSKSVQERIEALEELRYRDVKFFLNESNQRFQRVYTITKQNKVEYLELNKKTTGRTQDKLQT